MTSTTCPEHKNGMCQQKDSEQTQISEEKFFLLNLCMVGVEKTVCTFELAAYMEDMAQQLCPLSPASSTEPVQVSVLVGGALSGNVLHTSVHREEGGSREGYTKDMPQNDKCGLVSEDDGTQRGGCKVHDSEEAWSTFPFHTEQLL